MRVVQINSYSNGSTGHIANAIHNALLANGHESLFAFGNGPDIPEGGYRIGSKPDFLCHTLVSLCAGLHGYSSVFSTFRLINRIKAFHPDVVHLHNLHGSYLNLDTLLNFAPLHLLLFQLRLPILLVFQLLPKSCSMLLLQNS